MKKMVVEFVEALLSKPSPREADDKLKKMIKNPKEAMVALDHIESCIGTVRLYILRSSKTATTKRRAIKRRSK